MKTNMENEQLREEWRKHYLKMIAKKMPPIDEMADWWLAKLEEAKKEAVEGYKSKVVLYVSSCNEHGGLSHENRLKLNAEECEIYLGDTTEEVWGDDWNDAPDDCNSGTPYSNTVKGLEIIKVRLGKPLHPHSKDEKLSDK